MIRTPLALTIAATTLATLAPGVFAQSTKHATAPQSKQPNRPAPIPEAADSWSAMLRSQQAERRKMREMFEWSSLSPEAQEALWSELVGPDQLNDGFGRARVRPSMQDQSGYDDREGGFEDRDVPLVELSWVQTPALVATFDQFLGDSVLNVEGDVLLAGYRSDNSIRVMEIDGTRDSASGGVTNWSRTFAVPRAFFGVDVDLFAAASDTLGNAYVSGVQPGRANYPLITFNGVTGAETIGPEFPAGAVGGSPMVLDMAIDPEGMVYVVGTTPEAGGTRRWFVAKHDPRNANAQAWITYIPGPAENTGGITINRFGEIFITGSKRITSTNFDVFVARVSAYDGAIEWTMTDASPDLDEVADIELDATGTPHISGSVDVVGGGRAGKTIKVDRATGAVVWRQQITGYNYDLVVDEAGSVYVTGEGSTPSVARTTKYSSAGTQLWSVSRGTTADIPSIALDRLGNPYVAYRYGSGAALVEAVKYNPATGSVVWAYSVDAVASSQESNSNLRVRNVHVDAGGNVYITGNRSGTSSGGSGHALFCVRLEQPYVSIPQIARSTPNVRVEDHSVWLPHVEDIGSQGFNNTFRLFSIDVDQLANEPLIDDLLDIEVDYVLGTARGQVDVDLSNNVAIGVDFVTGATGGSYDATASGELEIVVPGEGELVAGQPFTVAIDFEPDASGMEMIANSTPELTAAFKSNVTGTLDLDLRGYNRNLGGPYSTIFDVDVPTPTLSTLDNLTLFSILGPSLPAPGTWVNFDLPGVSGRLTMPRLLAEGAYSTSAPGGTNSGSASDDDVMRLSSSLSETFCDLGVSVTDIITTTATGFPLSFGWGLPAGGSGTDASLGVGLLQAHLDGNMKVEQDLTLDMKPYVRLEFPDTSLSPITVDLVQRVQANGVTSFGPESPVTLTLPAGTGTMEIKPFFGIRAKMRNQSGFRFGASVGFDAFSVEATVSVLDVNIINREYCFGCTEQPIANARFNVFDYTSPEFNFTGNEPGDTEIELASIQVVGSTTTKPQLIGASRAAVPMIIYEQRTPTQAELTAAASGTEPMILYGRQFFGNTSQVNKAFIRHHGRTEELTTERLNDQALRVQIPRRFYLLPGIARIWTTNGNGRSETIDFPIEHPFPNFQGIAGLDGETNPVAWASDPRWSTEPVVAVDGGTPAGNDSFIARRDYYTQLRTALWSPNLFPVGHASSNLTADAYFPAFKGWELPGARKQPPGFPTLIVDGVALGRHRPFINDGYFRSKPQASLFALPHVATLELINPGPGGGASRVRTVDIVAPPPVITHMEPATLAPDTDAIGGKVRVVVYGPDSVPYFPGYESLKAGNFTPESVVRFNGVDMPTTFVNSGQLTAEIPGDDVAVVGAHLVSVYTPSGGTSYTERLTTGGGSVGSSTTVASGGVSVPITFTVAWPAPQIAAVSHDEITVNEVPYVSTPTDGSPSDGHNFGITGSNFAPGCTVFWNGRPLAATRLSAGAIRATVPASFIASPGAVQVIVVNPSPNRRASTPATVQIVP